MNEHIVLFGDSNCNENIILLINIIKQTILDRNIDGRYVISSKEKTTSYECSELLIMMHDTEVGNARMMTIIKISLIQPTLTKYQK